MKKLGMALGLSLAALLAGCGGGGGSAGNTQLEYKISLRADTVALPVNIGNVGPSIGTDAPYTTVLHVTATEGGNPIVGTKGAFACNIDAGLNVGALYYLDGDPSHETVVDGKRIPNAYRNITLDSNSGGNSFHFHAGNTRGAATITCSITNPRDNQVSATSVQIVVGNGGAPAVGMPASVALEAASGYLGAQNNPNNVRNTVSLQAMLRDEVGQWVADTPTPNLQVYIQASDAAAGARLIRDRQSGTVIMTNTRNGIADFSLSSGSQIGVITLVLVADRADNNVANGIQDPIIQRMVIPVVNGIAQKPLAVQAQAVTATCRQEVSTPLVATDGLPPYQWSSIGNMPVGLSLTADGLVTGVPRLVNGSGAGSYQVAVQVTDANGTSQITTLTINVDAGECKPLSINSSSLSVTKGTSFAFALSATGGKPAYTWSSPLPLPTGLTLSPAGILSGAIGTAGSYPIVVQVTDADGIVVSANLTVAVTDPAATKS